MQRKISAPTFKFKQTGRDMALSTLNSNAVGGNYKAWAEEAAIAGLEKPPKTVW